MWLYITKSVCLKSECVTDNVTRKRFQELYLKQPVNLFAHHWFLQEKHFKIVGPGVGWF